MNVAILLLAAAAAARPESRCTLCHPDVRVQFERGVHHAEGVACTSCHGGDPEATTVPEAHRKDFRGDIKRRDVPALCASCHADIAKMRPYNLPADQYALYQTSLHGRRLAQGDEKPAICTDCHGVHEIRAPSDPRSSVFPRNIPSTCGRCHADSALMAGYGLKAESFNDYTTGIHGKALLEEGSVTAPDCSRCHGAHGAAPTGVGDIDKVCGQCHSTARSYFIEGPHKAAMVAAGLPECASCHGHHLIAKTDTAMLDTVCLQCHDQSSSQVQLAAKMKTLLTNASDEIASAGRAVETAASVPLYVEDYRARLAEARTSFIEASPAVHSLDLSRVEALTGRVRSISREVESEVSGKLEGRKWRRVGLMVFWFYLLVTVGILIRFRTNAARRAAASAEHGG